MADSRLESTLKFAKRGWPVFPVRENKLPAITKWEEKATADPEQIRTWFADAECVGGCNFGFCPGRAGIFVIDTDRNKMIDGKLVDGEDSLRDFVMGNAGNLPETFTVRTPSGGLHRYYKAADLRSKNAFLPAVDVKSCGGYVVIPGSMNDKGSYIVEKDLPVAELPVWFKALYGRRKQAKEKNQISYKAKITADTPEKVRRAIEIIEGWKSVSEGERNDNLFQMMRELCKAGISKQRASELYAEYGLEKIGLDPDTAEVAATVNSAYADMSDFGQDSEEARKLMVNLFDDLPDDPDAKETDPGAFGVDWTELEVREVPERRWFIENWLSADEGYTVLFSGRGGTGKSAMVIDLMRSLATGEPWCGMDVKRGAKSMYISCEDSEEELTRRIKRRSDPGGRVPAGIIRLVSRLGEDNVLCSIGKDGKLRAEPFFKELKKQAREFFGTDGGVLILDTLSDVFAGNENDRSHVSQFVKHQLNKLGRDVGVTIIMLAHPAKGGSQNGQGFSGSTAWEGAFRCRWELNYQKADKVDGLLELVLAKSNTAKPGQKVTLKNSGGLFYVVDSAGADESVKEAIIELIDAAYESGNPFGMTIQANRPITLMKINDPITGVPLTPEEIKEIVTELKAEAVIENFHDRTCRGLRVIKREGEEK